MAFAGEVFITSGAVLQPIMQAQFELSPQLQPRVGYEFVLQILQGVKTLDVGRLVVVLLDVAIAEAQFAQQSLTAQQLPCIELHLCFQAHSVNLAEVDRFPHQRARFVLRSVTDPVDKVRVVVVKDRRRRRHGIGSVAHTGLQRGQFFGLQVGIGQMTALAVIQFRHRRHAQRRVVTGVNLQSVGHAQAGVEARIDVHRPFAPAIFRRHDAARKRQTVEQHVVFQNKLRAGAVQSLLV